MQYLGYKFAAANRHQTLVDNYPLFSLADDALWLASQDYQHLGDRYEKQEILNLTKLVREYPLSVHNEDAKARLEELKAPIPEADQVAYDRMKYELANKGKVGPISHFFGVFSAHPNLVFAARSGAPQMQTMRPSVPANVPARAAGVLGTSGDITASVATDASALDTKPDARAPAGTEATQGTVTAQSASAVQKDAVQKTAEKAGKAKPVKASKSKAPKAPKKTSKQPPKPPADSNTLPKPDLPSDSGAPPKP